MNSIEEIRALVLELPPQERASLARDLLLSLEPDDFDDEVESAWLDEVEGRAEAFAQGVLPALDWRESIARARQALTQRRQS